MDSRPLYCNYYGRLEGELLGDNVAIMAVDEAMLRIVEKNEDKLIKIQEKIVEQLRNSFRDEIREFRNTVKLLNQRMTEIESQLPKKEEKGKKK